MRVPSWRSLLRGAGVRRDLGELRDLAVRYVKEETVQPLKDMVRYALYGALGSVFVGLGVLFVFLAVLRFFQEQFRVFDGTLSWIPYLIVAALALLVAGVTLWRIVSGAGERRVKSTK